MEYPQAEILCPLCQKKVVLQEDSSVDENGKAVHTECYAKQILGERMDPTVVITDHGVTDHGVKHHGVKDHGVTNHG
jgi:hypothetical protein